MGGCLVQKKAQNWFIVVGGGRNCQFLCYITDWLDENRPVCFPSDKLCFFCYITRFWGPPACLFIDSLARRFNDFADWVETKNIFEDDKLWKFGFINVHLAVQQVKNGVFMNFMSNQNNKKHEFITLVLNHEGIAQTELQVMVFIAPRNKKVPRIIWYQGLFEVRPILTLPSRHMGSKIYTCLVGPHKS